jgi:hypothetical protein
MIPISKLLIGKILYKNVESKIIFYHKMSISRKSFQQNTLLEMNLQNNKKIAFVNAKLSRGQVSEI